MVAAAWRLRVRGLAVLLVGAVLLALALLALPPALETERGRALAGALVELLTGFELRAAAIEVGPGPALVAREIVLVRAGGEPLLVARRARLGLLKGSMFGGRPVDLALDGFIIDLSTLQRETGERSYERRPGTAREDAVGAVGRPLGRVRALDGAVRWSGRDGPAGVLVDALVFDHEPGAAHLQTRGRLRLERGSGLLKWQGRYNARDGRVELDVDAEWPELVSASATLGVALPKLGGLLGVKASGRVRGSLRERVEAELDAVLTGDAPLAGAAAVLRLQYASDTRATHGSIDIALADSLPPLVVTLAVPGDRRAASELSASWRDVPLDVLAAGMLARAGLERVRGRTTASLHARAIGADLEARASVSAEGVSAQLAGIELAGALEFAGAYEDGVLTIGERGLRASGVKLRGRAGTVSAAAVTLAGSVRGAESGGRTVQLESLVVEGLSASDPSWTRAVDGGELRGRATLSLGGEEGATLAGSLAIERGEALWGRVYTRLSELQPELVLEARLAGDRVDVQRFEGSLRGLGRFVSRFRFRPGHGLRTAAIELDAPGLGRAFDLLVREPLAHGWPTLAASSLSGHLTGQLEYAAEDDGGRFSGRVALGAGRVDIDRGRSLIDGVELSLPVNLSASGRAQGGSQSGRLRIGSLRLRGVDLGALTLPMRARTNEIAGTATVELPLLGGRVSFGDFRARNLMKPERSVSMWLSARDLDLASLADAAGFAATDGRLHADFSNLGAAATEVVADGQLRVDLLGGRVEVSNLKITDIGTRIPRLHAEIDARGIDLGRATGALGVGRVDGIVDATVRGLEIVDGQPVRFDASLESVVTRGVKQRISVAAIEQLSILGGAAASPLTQTVLGFFDEYRYAKMGARCSLRNDRFLLRGIERYEEKDFLVVGTFMPPTVNVVSHNQVIAFNEMLRRLARIADVSSRSRTEEQR